MKIYKNRRHPSPTPKSHRHFKSKENRQYSPL